MDFRMNLDYSNPLRLYRFSPRIGTPAFILVLMVLGVLTLSLLYGGIWGGGQDLAATIKAPSKGLGDPPVFAYWISGTGGDVGRIVRLLKAVYHPRNHYLLHLDSGSNASERDELALAIQSQTLFRAFGNVDVIGKTYAVDKQGSSAVAATLHGASILLKISRNWDWFITLSASDYPIVTQDDLLHAFTYLPRDLNFIDHTSDLGWKEYERFDRIAVDPSLYMNRNSQLFYASETRATPEAFTLFTGSPWVILSRPFVEHCVLGTDNFPRKLLMYFANAAYASESYFQTVICNTPGFRNTTVNRDLRFFLWDDPPKLEPLFLNQSDYRRMVGSGSAFARKFLEGDPVLGTVDRKVLHRPHDGPVPGGWCSGGKDGSGDDPCSKWGDIDTVNPGKFGTKLRSLVSRLASEERLHSNQCRF